MECPNPRNTWRGLRWPPIWAIICRRELCRLTSSAWTVGPRSSAGRRPKIVSSINGRKHPLGFGPEFLTGPGCCSNAGQQVATASKPWELPVASAGCGRRLRQWRRLCTVVAQVVAGLWSERQGLGASGQQTGSTDRRRDQHDHWRTVADRRRAWALTPWLTCGLPMIPSRSLTVRRRGWQSLVRSDMEEDEGSTPPAPTGNSLNKEFVSLLVSPNDGMDGREGSIARESV
jgi:hypothetical protein